MESQIERWIDDTNIEHHALAQPCSKLSQYFVGYYSEEFLANARFVVVDTIPKPDFPELREQGLSDFIDIPVDGITYKNHYYVRREVATRGELHFHELVHVAQWQLLGAQEFIQRYISEIASYGYENSPLERMAYGFQAKFESRGKPFDVPSHVIAGI